MAEPEDNLRAAMEDRAREQYLYADKTLFLASIAISLKRIADAVEGMDLGNTIHNAISSGIYDARPKS